MRKFYIGLVAATAAGVLPAWGQEAELFDKLDANKDGFVTSDEVPDDKQTIFERLLREGDANKDKKLTKEELVAGLKKAQPQAEAPATARPGGPGGAPNISPKEIFARMDRNSDGKLDKDEIPERMKENLARVDTNSDGNVDLAEFEKVAGFFAGRRPDGAPGERPAEARPGQPAPGQGTPGLFAPVVRALDTNADGEISADEIAAAAKSLAKLDRNGDGKLSREEIGPPPGGRPDARPGEGNPAARPGAGASAEEFIKRLKAADTNGDGKISKEEAPDRLKENFDRIDTNSDGQLDESELKAMAERMRAGGAAPGGDQPRRRPGAEPKTEPKKD